MKNYYIYAIIIVYSLIVRFSANKLCNWPHHNDWKKQKNYWRIVKSQTCMKFYYEAKFEVFYWHRCTSNRAHEGGISDTWHWPIFCVQCWHWNQNQCQSTPILDSVSPTLDIPLLPALTFSYPRQRRTFRKISSQQRTFRHPSWALIMYMYVVS